MNLIKSTTGTEDPQHLRDTFGWNIRSMQLVPRSIKDAGTAKTCDITRNIVCIEDLFGIKIILFRIDQKTESLSLNLFDRTECTITDLLFAVKQCSVKIRNDQLYHLAVLLCFLIISRLIVT